MSSLLWGLVDDGAGRWPIGRSSGNASDEGGGSGATATVLTAVKVVVVVSQGNHVEGVKEVVIVGQWNSSANSSFRNC